MKTQKRKYFFNFKRSYFIQGSLLVCVYCADIKEHQLTNKQHMNTQTHYDIKLNFCVSFFQHFSFILFLFSYTNSRSFCLCGSRFYVSLCVFVCSSYNCVFVVKYIDVVSLLSEIKCP